MFEKYRKGKKHDGGVYIAPKLEKKYGWCGK